MSLVNYLGTYETLDQVWETYPEGGKEGDYLYIASVLKKWNKYTSAWADPTEEDVEGSTIMSLEEDVVVGSSTLINYLGRFETLENALDAYPEGGNEGDYIYVGDDIYAWDKYANEWVVSLDAPLEVAISEEDIIPDSNTFINYLGGFVDRDAVWHKYPEGGKVGDYLYIASDLHIWDKYICNWVAATPPDESSQIRPIEHFAQEGVVEYSENYINYLGVFESIEQAWEAYPEGGKEGDYIIVGGEQLRWNKYTNNWGEYDPDASTPARPVATIYGDLHVHNDVIIGEDLYARILETFTTKKWVLEQGFISVDDVTSELVMSKIVPDNKTIGVRDGKLVVIGGGGSGGGSGGGLSVEDLETYLRGNKYTTETWVSNQLSKYILKSDMPLRYDAEKQSFILDGNLILSGGLATRAALGDLDVPTIMDAIVTDEQTIIKEDGILKINPNIELGGGLDEAQLEDYLIEKNYAKKSDITSALSSKANKAITLAGYGITDAYTKSHIDSTFVKLATVQDITARHNFTDGLKIGGLPIYKSQDDVIYIDANLVVRGGFVSRGTNGTSAPSIYDGLPIDNSSIYWENGVLKAVSGGGVADSVAWNNITGKPETLTTFLSTGNASTATKLQTARSLWGLTFDGSKDLTGSLTVITGEGYRIKYNGYDLRFIVSGSSANRGIWDNTLNSWMMYRDDTENVRFPKGNISIGDASPSYKLHVHGTLGVSGDVTFGGKVNISGQVTFAAGGFLLAHSPNDTWTDANSVAHPWYGLDFRVGGNYKGTISHWSGITLASGYDINLSSQKNVVVSNGNFRINQSAFDNGLILNRTVANSGVGIVAMSNDVRLGQFGINGTKTFEISGDNGIVAEVSTTTGAATFNGLTTINHSSNTPLVINQTYAANNSRGVVLMNGSMGNGHIYYSHLFGKAASTKNSAYIGFYNAGAGSDSNYLSMGLYGVNNVLNITAAAKVGIGTTTPTQALHVNGKGIFADATNPWVAVQRDGVNWYVQVTSGGMRIGKSSALGILVDETGNLLIPGGLTLNYSSDKRLKKNIRKFNAAETLLSLGGVYEYEYIDSEVEKNHIYKGTHIGLIYQNVSGSALKSMCCEREDGMGALNYVDTSFLSLIAGATMENTTEIKALKNDNIVLKNENIALRKRVKQLEDRLA